MKSIVAIHAGQAKTQNEGERTFSTAIVKQRLTGPVTITLDGVAGDEVVNHKNPLYAFCAENYDHWNSVLEHQTAWPYGYLGENLTLKGIEEQHVCIGDLLIIGGVVLRVSGCRTPCETLLWRIGAPPTFLAQFQRSGRSGFYLEVLHTGVIQAGDRVEHIGCGYSSISVGELAKVLMQPDVAARKKDWINNLPGIGQQMQNQLLAAARASTCHLHDSVDSWSTFVVKRIVNEAQDVKSFYISALESHSEPAPFKAGQFLSVRLKTPSKGVVIRCWSISGFDQDSKSYRITIKRKPFGAASTFMHDDVDVGFKLEINRPAGNFKLRRARSQVPIVLISAGIGITPMVSMLKEHLSVDDKSISSLHFIHTTANRQSHAFLNEVQLLASRHDRVMQHYLYTRKNQRLNQSGLTRILSGIGQRNNGQWCGLPPTAADYYLCGPPGFLADVREMLSALGVANSQIFQESFNDPTKLNSDRPLGRAKVSFANTGKVVDWLPEKDLSLLALAESVGLNPVYSCRAGQCGLCRAEILQGNAEYCFDVMLRLPDNQVLLCCTRPNGDLTIAINQQETTDANSNKSTKSV